MPTQHRVARGIAAIVLFLAAGIPARAALLTPDQKNLQASTEAAILSHSMLSEALGFPVGQTLSFTGAFDASTWSLSMDGIFRDVPIALTFTGFSDPTGNTGSYSSTGAAGATSLNSSGSWTFSDVDPDTTLMDWDAEVTLSSSASASSDGILRRILDRRVIAKRFLPGPRGIIDIGLVQRTIFGIPIGPLLPEVSLFVLPIPSPLPPFLPFSRSITIEGDSDLTSAGEIDQSLARGTISGTTTTIPEPSGLLLSAMAVVIIAVSRKRRRRGTF